MGDGGEGRGDRKMGGVGGMRRADGSTPREEVREGIVREGEKRKGAGRNKDKWAEG